MSRKVQVAPRDLCNRLFNVLTPVPKQEKETKLDEYE